MCRMSHGDNPAGNWCTELERDPKKWNKKCLLPIPDKFRLEDKVSDFIEAIQFFCAEKAKINDVIIKAQADELKEWYTKHSQVAGDNRARIIAYTAPPVCISSPILIDKNCPFKNNKEDDKIKQDILDRDSYHCRYCGNRLIDRVVWEKLAELAKDDKLKLFGQELINKKEEDYTTARNDDVPGLFFFTCPSVDHVNPCNNGGAKTESNLVSSCYACNYGKGKFTCEQVGIKNPFTRPPIKTEWDGLKSLIPKLDKLLK